MKNKVVFFCVIISIGFVMVLIDKALNTTNDKDAIKQMNSKLNAKNKEFNLFAFSYKYIDLGGYKGRSFLMSNRSKDVFEGVYIEEQDKFLSIGGRLKGFDDFERRDMYILMHNLDIESLTIYEDNNLKLKTKFLNRKLNSYSYYYTDNWEGALSSLLTDYVIIRDQSRLENVDKWIYVIDDHWGIMN